MAIASVRSTAGLFSRRTLKSGTLAVLLAGYIAAVPSGQGDVTPPTVTAQSPAANATGVSTLIVATATFSEPVQSATIVMQLRNSGSQLIAASVTYDPASQTASLDPTPELAGSQTFTVTVSGARDLAGNAMTAVSWSFTTGTAGFQDTVLPQTGLVDPVVIQFAEDGRLFVAEKSGRIYAYDSLSDTTPTLAIDLRTAVYNFWDRGMLGMVLHPNFPATPYLYVLYAYDAIPGGTAPRWGTAGQVGDPCPTPPGPTGDGCVITGRLSRLNVGNSATWPLNASNEEVLVTDWFQQFPSHSTGGLAFGADGALYATGGDGASFNYVDSGQTPSTPLANDPSGEGGALRSQDILTTGDPVALNGSVIRIHPDTGGPLPDNPRITDPDINGKRIVAHGLRNPFRLTIRPGTNEVWVGDVGWSTWEEINRILDGSDPVVENFGWPCYEGAGTQSGYQSIGMCQQLPANAVTPPYYAYNHNAKVVAGEACPTGSSSIAGLAFYPESGGSYPDAYDGALFFADYSRNCIWAMRTGADGLPNPADRVTIRSGGGGPVNLVSGPGGDIFYPGFDDDRLHRLTYVSGNLPPAAVAQANPTSGTAPLTVNFDATGSSDPEGQPLAYAWDLDGDGAFDDSASATPSFTYGPGGQVTVRVRVSDNQGLSAIGAVVISLDNTAPTAAISTPQASLAWSVGDAIAFSGGATDPEEGPLPPSALTWSVIMHHCPSNCHAHDIQQFAGMASGTVTAPDHEFPSHLELRLTAIDNGGLQSTASVLVHPRTVTLTFQSSPAGLQLAINGASGTAPFNRTVIVGSSNSVSAASPQAIGPTSYSFSSWSDAGAQVHNVTAPAAATTYTATFGPVGGTPGLVAGYPFNEGSGTTTADLTVNNLTGTVSGAAWTTAGKFGNALSFDGVNDWVSVADASVLDLTTGMTLEAWVFPTANGGGSWRNLVIKEQSGGEIYNLYTNTDVNAPAVYVVRASQPGVPLGAAGTSQLPLNAWSHVAATYDNTTLRLYVNGVQVGSRAVSGALLASTGALRIGGNSIWGEFFAGRIDEVRIYGRALSPSELQNDMVTPLGTPLPDSTPPGRFDGLPVGTLPPSTTQAVLSLSTDEAATCRYSTTPGVAYSAMTNTFATTGATSHSTTVSGLVAGGSYSFFVRCRDAAANVNANDFTISFAIAPAGTLPPGMVAGYAFNEGSGTTTVDLTPNNLTGTLNGAAWTTAGKFGNALSFDGVNDWVTVADANALDLTTGMTLEAWVFPTASGAGSWRNLIMKERPGGEIYNLYTNVDTNRPAVYVVRASQPGAPLGAAGTSQLPLNAWTHVAATYDNTTLRLYVNGVQAGSQAVSGALLASTGALRIGGNSIWGEFFAGRIDEVRIYNRALSVSEVQSDMNTPLGTPGPDTTPPVRSNGQPSGVLPAGTTQTTLSVSTNEAATCRYSATAGVAYGAMTTTFSTTGGTAHSTLITGLTNGGSYTYFVRCQDSNGNASPDDFPISFSVAQTPPPDTTPPVRSNGQPSGTLPAGTLQTTMSLATDENATCRYATTAGVTYGAMSNIFAATGGSTHSTTVSGLTNGASYSFFVRCVDGAGNPNSNDFTISFSVAQPAPPPTGLVAAYGFNEGTGTTAADASGNSHTGTIAGAVWTPSGRFGNALSFDGVNDWVTVADASALDLTTGMTLEAWVFPTAGGANWRNVLIKERQNGEVYNLYGHTTAGVPVVYVVRASAPNAPLDASGTAALPLNAWSHLAATYNGSTLRLFVNGTQVGSRTVTGALITSTGVLRIGGNGIWGEFFAGRIDEVRVYNRALTQAEIQTDMNGPVQ